MLASVIGPRLIISPLIGMLSTTGQVDALADWSNKLIGADKSTCH
ncbi:MAG: hypothetical protein ACJAV0_000931 [Shewanella sp.]|jgi:hypothetical protein